MDTTLHTNKLLTLAQTTGISGNWNDDAGNSHSVPAATFQAILKDMGIDPKQPKLKAPSRLLEPVWVLQENEGILSIPIYLPEPNRKHSFSWELTFENNHRLEGELHHTELIPERTQPAHHQAIQEYRYHLDVTLPQGYHRFLLKNEHNGDEEETLLIVTPLCCYHPGVLEKKPTQDHPKAGKIWGTILQLSALSSDKNWGIGDFCDLQRVIDWSAEKGASIIELEPLHTISLRNNEDLTPYIPSSRLFYNPFYLDIEAMDDFRESEEARQIVYSPTFQETLKALRQAKLLNYVRIGQCKMDVLQLLYQNFCKRHLAQNTSRARDFYQFVISQGRALETFSLYQALQEHFQREDPNMQDWPTWPEAYQHPENPAVLEFSESNRERIGFFNYLQWQTERQLDEAGLRCLKQHLGVGLCLDLAIGVDRGGSDVWANRHLYAQTCSIGTPPDKNHPLGKNWGLSPLIPEKLREDRYQTFIKVLRRNMRHAGAVKIDSLMALFHLFWIPAGSTPEQGAYVNYPMDEIFGILALESQRNHCMIICNDSELLPDTVRTRMQRWGIFPNKVFYEEKDSSDQFKSPQDYLSDAVISVSSRNFPTLTDFWEGKDIATRTEMHLYPDKESRDRQIRERALERIEILSLLEREHLLPEGMSPDPASVPEMTPPLTLAIHRLLARSISRICLVRFEDILQQTEQNYAPGTIYPTYPNWMYKLTLSLDVLLSDPRLGSVSEVLTEERPQQKRPMELPQPYQNKLSTPAIPQATYRLQFHQNFTFAQAANLVPYLSSLGISHCYASPLLTARPGSLHGYDITNHKQLNHEIGSREDFDHLTRTLKDHGMGLIVDIVPNHMGAGKDNPWWMDVLENGPSSVYADYFDIDWHPLTENMENKILLPILGDAYGRILENGELKLRFDAATGRLWLDYYEHAVPINPLSYPTILGYRLEVLESRLGNNNSPLFEYQSILASMENLPVENDGDLSRKEARAREKMIALERLTRLGKQTPEIQAFIEENVYDFQCRAEDPTTLTRLHRLLEQQSYRLANWRVASDEINYRRFFDINDLVALRVEDPRVFNDTHDLIMELVENGQIDGLRIDHPDGLYDPAGYFQQLQQEVARRLNLPESPTWKLGSPDLPFYVVIEKILAPFERLPEEWTIHGTTGYEFANAVNGLFVHQESEREFTRLYEKLLGRRIPFEDLVYQCKKLIMKTTLNSELGVLSNQLNRISKKHWSFRDFTLHNLRTAIMEVVACFPVYRTYVTPDRVSKKDREYIEWAIRAAKRRSQAEDTSIFDFINRVLLNEDLSLSKLNTVSGEEDGSMQELFRQSIIRFAMKFQQYTGPVMAKGLEDTSFYRYNRLASLNEVGGEPRQFGLSVITFHHQNAERQQRVPHTLLTTSTHDTKRSEDVRARLSVLSEMSDEWHRHVAAWRRTHRNLRKTLDDGEHAPDLDMEYLFYQALLGIWPFTHPDDETLSHLSERLDAYMLKASREAKSHTSWINPNQAYEDALSYFVRSVVQKPSRLFLDDFLPFHKIVSRYGLFNSLAQTMLKLTCPGVPDIYQGMEMWDFSLVDPDNRRPVDYHLRGETLHQMQQVTDTANQQEFEQLLTELTANMTNGHIKSYLINIVLNFRKRHPNLFSHGAYIPLEVSGIHAEHVVAFARKWEDQIAVVAVPRLLYTLGLRKNELPYGKRVWRDTVILLPASLRHQSSFYNLLTHTLIERKNAELSEIPISELLNSFPVALITNSKN
jgi:(1->4)-alpha-D-glucan 1-alpha-D-glucosylmutase